MIVSMRSRFVVRLLVSIAAGLGAWAFLSHRFRAGGAYLYALDFTPHWRAADAMIRGYSPYAVINAFSTQYPFGAGYLNMLPAAAILLPFGYMDPQHAAALFEGLSIAVFTFAITRDGFWRLPLLASFPLVYCILSAQVVPLVTAAFLLPWLGWLAPVKFTTGAVGGVYTLSKRYIALALAVIVISIAIWPWWPAQWWAERRDVAGVYYHIPAALTGGFVVFLALLRWRRPEGRLLVAMACVPQTMLFYDQLPLTLIARTYREALVVALLSYAPLVISILLYGTQSRDRAQLFALNAPLILACYYFPCLVETLRRPNEGDVPSWMNTAAARFSRLGRTRTQA
jgi:hypothetical protein